MIYYIVLILSVTGVIYMDVSSLFFFTHLQQGRHDDFYRSQTRL